nr:hypothetical protein [uncultured Lachnoclostridium sp.]
MKKAAIYAISFLSLSVLLSTCYFVSYRYALNKFNRNATEQSGVTKKLSGTGSYDVSANTKTTVSKDASYTLQIYDLATDKLKEKKENIPNDFVGMTRDQIINRLNVYVQNKSLDEYNKGLVSWQLVSFAPDRVVVKKTYNSEGILYKYFMIIRDGNVVVYYSDKKTIYEDETGINLDELSEVDKRELMYGKWIQDENELYSLLDGYTS